MHKKWLLLAVIALVGGVLTQKAYMKPAEIIQFEHGVWFDSAREKPEVTLVSSEEKTSAWPLFNEWHLVFFGFTYCPDICPTTLYELKALEKDFPSLKVLFVSLDPKRDTPERLKQYLNRLGSNFKGATATDATLEILTRYFTVAYQKVKQGDSYTIDHSGTIFLLDGKGDWRGLFSHGTTPEEIASDLRKVVLQ